MDKLLTDIPGACAAIGCGKTYLYTLAKRGKVRLVKLGRATRIPVADLQKLAAEGTDDAQ